MMTGIETVYCFPEDGIVYVKVYPNLTGQTIRWISYCYGPHSDPTQDDFQVHSDEEIEKVLKDLEVDESTREERPYRGFTIQRAQRLMQLGAVQGNHLSVYRAAILYKETYPEDPVTIEELLTLDDPLTMYEVSGS